MSHKRDINEIRKEFEREDYTLLSTEYISNKTKLEIKHNSCGHIFNMRYNSFSSEKQRCPKCANKIRGEKARNAQLGQEKEYLRANSDEKNKEIDVRCGTEYTRIGSYTRSRDKIAIKHNKCGNIYYPIVSNFLSKTKPSNCCYCYGTISKTTEMFKEEVSKNTNDEYSFIGPYTFSQEKTLFKHNVCGSEFLMRPDRFNFGDRCPICKVKRVSEKISYTKEEFQEILNNKFNNEYEIISDYNRANSNITIKHKICGELTENKASYIRDSIIPCKKCKNNGRSSEELELEEFIKSLNNKVSHFKLKRQELDIYIENKKIGFEYDGLYWHSDDKKDKNAHINKTKFFKENNIRVIHIFSDEWKFKKEIVKDKIKSILGVQKEKIYARKCIIKEISSQERNKFLNENHIQGADKAVISLGLFNNEKLVAVMSLSKLRKALGNKNKDGNYELSRFAGLINTTVVGGFSKLLKYAINNYNINEIITYADLRFTSYDTNVYTKNGFVLDHISDPSYWYFNKSTNFREHRFNYRKQVLKEKFPDIYDDKKTENQIMREAGYYRIWDCGNLVYKMIIK